MKSRRRGLVVLVIALLIAGLLIWKDVDQQRAVAEYNRKQIELMRSGYPPMKGISTIPAIWLYSFPGCWPSESR